MPLGCGPAVNKTEKSQTVYIISKRMFIGIDMKQAQCSCGAEFMTVDEQELVEIIKFHGKRAHLRNVLNSDARRMIVDEKYGALVGEEITAARAVR